MKKVNRIHIAMRENEASLLKHMRQHSLNTTTMLGNPWSNALDRLKAKGMVKFDKKRSCYVARKYAHPVTAVR